MGLQERGVRHQAAQRFAEGAALVGGNGEAGRAVVHDLRRRGKGTVDDRDDAVGHRFAEHHREALEVRRHHEDGRRLVILLRRGGEPFEAHARQFAFGGDPFEARALHAIAHNHELPIGMPREEFLPCGKEAMDAFDTQ